MWAVVVRRIAAMLFAILFLTALVFFMMQAVLGDPVILMLGQDADPGTIARLRQDLGFNRPAYVQYTDWLGRLVRGDWGRSFRTGQPVLEAILARLPSASNSASCPSCSPWLLRSGWASSPPSGGTRPRISASVC